MTSVIETVSRDVATAIEPDEPEINIALITVIADLIFSLIERCREKNDDEDVVNRVSNPGPLQRLRLRVKARRELPREYRGKANEVADALVEAAQDESKVRAAVAEVADIDDYFLC